MNNRVRPAALCALLVILAMGAMGQQQAARTTGAVLGSYRVAVGTPSGPSVTGAPYSAEETTENVQSLADGTHITQTLPAVKTYRDSAGRTRTERSVRDPMQASSESTDAPVMITITDPVAHVMYTLNAAEKVAHKQIFASPVATRTTSSKAPAPDVDRPKSTVEKLGKQTIEGVLADGTRRTTVWAVGSIGNDRPVTVVSETWTSPELKVVVLSKQSDPRSGDHTQKLTNISRSEPDPSLFQPPADYTVEETGEILRH